MAYEVLFTATAADASNVSGEATWTFTGLSIFHSRQASVLSPPVFAASADYCDSSRRDAGCLSLGKRALFPDPHGARAFIEAFSLAHSGNLATVPQSVLLCNTARRFLAET